MDTNAAAASPHQSRLGVLTLGALGVVFGDIGTSPLYALKECFHPSHGIALTSANILGILSLIFWSLTIIVSLKYIAFIMRADNHGEGGIMALLALNLRGDANPSRRRMLLVTVGLFGAALFFGDGVITPAISVLSAIEGLSLAAPAFDPLILPITLAVLFGLFAVQRYGTASVGRLFGPVMVVWFTTLGGLGLVKVIQYPEVLAAINPLYALEFVLANRFAAFVTLGAVVLTITGGEALYADMGHFGRRPITIAWFGLVLPGLFLNYCGQGAMLLHDPAAVENPFFRLAPAALLYPMIALATAATVIASQAVISGVYSIARQAVQLGYLPRVHIKHTSSEEIGQIYVPQLNWLLFGAIALLVLTFKTSSNLAAAYGIAVTLTMICDTVLASVIAHRLWGWHPLTTTAVTVPLLLLDFAFFGATSMKILEGGWFPLLMGVSAYTLMATWKRGREILFERLDRDTLPLRPFIEAIAMDSSIAKVPGTAVFMTSNHRHVPHALLHNLKHNKVLHERVVLLTLVTRDMPFLDDAERVQIESMAEGFALITGYYGFKEQPNVPALLELCAHQGHGFNLMDTSFFLSRETLIASVAPGMAIWREKLFVALSRNAASATEFFQIPTNRVVELGTQVEI
ncbi:MAG TPA: potassium transporter Kup [Porticoccaceae bacterium]|nr:potassium transporter Kup [Porticoccaceae bacterium]